MSANSFEEFAYGREDMEVAPASISSALEETFATFCRIRVDHATGKGSVNDLIQAVTGIDPNNISRQWNKVVKNNPSLANRVERIRINGEVST
jgi:hypothetical protein